MEPEEKVKLKETLTQSLYDYHYANKGATYRLPHAMLEMDESSKLVIEELIESGYATDSGQGSKDMLLAITEKGIQYIYDKKEY